MNEAIKKNGIKFGVIWATMYVLYTTILYVLGPLNLIQPQKYLTILIYLIIGVLVITSTKKSLNNIITFKEAFTVFFITSVIGLGISTIYDILLFNIIDPSIKEPIKEYLLNEGIKGMKAFGVKTEDLKKFADEINNNDTFSIKNILLGYVQYLLFASIFGLILAAIFKTKTTYNE
jgi:hypothetical protein